MSSSKKEKRNSDEISGLQTWTAFPMKSFDSDKWLWGRASQGHLEIDLVEHIRQEESEGNSEPTLSMSTTTAGDDGQWD